MKKVLIAAVIALAALILYPIIGYEGTRHCGPQTQEQSDIRQLCILVQTYKKKHNSYPKDLEVAMEEFQFSEPHFNEIIKEENFKYTQPMTDPKDTGPYTVIIEYVKDGIIYRGQVDGHVTIEEGKT